MACLATTVLFAQDVSTSPADATVDVRANAIVVESTRAAPLAMRFDGTTAAECEAWQGEFRAKLLELLGDSSPPTAWTVEEQSRRTFDDYLQLELLLSADGVPTLPLYLLIPAGVSAENPAPGVICIHGHGNHANDLVVGNEELDGAREEIELHNYDYGRQFVRRGYVVVAPCMVPFGRRVDRDFYRGDDPCGVIFLRMQAMGKLLITENLRDLRWAISYLASRPEVLADRIGSAGLSYGGRMSMMVSAVDDRVKVCCICGAWHLLQERVMSRYSTCGGQIIPGILQYGDYPEIASLIAPRPCVYTIGSQDGGVDREAGEEVTRRVKRAYAALGVSDRLYFDHFEGGHEFSGRISFGLFDEVLKP